VKLSALAFESFPYCETVSDALWAHIELAQYLESLGFSRYWVTEHRNPTSVYGACAVFLATLAGVTESIRVGSAGILLRYEVPYRVAEDFRLLEALYPNRIDLGVCNGKAPADVARELLDGRDESATRGFAERAVALDAILRGTSAPAAAPETGRRPPMWILSNGGESVDLAARLGAPLSLSLLHSAARQQSPESVVRYLAAFDAGPGANARPAWNIAVAGVCAETADEARRLAAQHTNRFVSPTVIGSPTQVKEQLLELATAYRVDEVVFSDVSRTREARHRSYGLLAEAFDLPAAAAGERAKEDEAHDAQAT
jgi:luciferase family oxidoreductase group 1